MYDTDIIINQPRDLIEKQNRTYCPDPMPVLIFEPSQYSPSQGLKGHFDIIGNTYRSIGVGLAMTGPEYISAQRKTARGHIQDVLVIVGCVNKDHTLYTHQNLK